MDQGPRRGCPVASGREDWDLMTLEMQEDLAGQLKMGNHLARKSHWGLREKGR